MQSLSDLPLRHKLTMLCLLTSAVALLLACAGFLSYEQFTFKGDLSADVATTAEMIGFNSASALAFDDASSAEQTMESLAAKPNIVAACIYGKDGELFATYPRQAARGTFGPRPPDGALQRFGPDSFELCRPIVSGGDLVGTIYLRSGLGEMRARLHRYALISAAVLAVAMLVAYLLTLRLQRMISAPVAELAAIARRVAADKDYSVRAAHRGSDELGSLVQGFNAMLGQIQARDTELQAAYDHLEMRVEERTAELKRENSERKRAEEALLESQALYRSLVDQMPAGIFRKDKSGRYVFVNAWFSRLKNLPPEKMLGRLPTETVDLPPGPAGAESSSEAGLAVLGIGHHAQIMETGRQIDVEEEYVGADGRMQYLHVVKSPIFGSDGSIVGSQGITFDITRHKTAEQALKRSQEEAARQQARFKFIFDSVPVGLAWMVRDRLDTRIVNPAYTGITGVEAGRSQELKPYLEAVHPDDRARQEALHGQLIAGEVDRYACELRYVHSDGSARWAALTVNLHRDTATGEAQEISTLVDITERKQVEDNLATIHQQLLETSRQAGMAEVATGVLHNVGNVLNSVNVSATIVSEHLRRTKARSVVKLAALFDQHKSDLAAFLTKDPRGQMIPSYLGTLAESLATEQGTVAAELENLRKNIEHIKDIVAMQQSYARTSGVMETVSVPDMIEDALRINSGSLARHDVEANREYLARPVVTTDRHKVIQILINLVRNAKYACDESGRVDKRITVRTTADDRSVRIAVIDNGVGIPPENLTRIFNHGFTTRKHGHGFGLHSGALAAKELGGALEVESSGPGTGATFILQLPYHPAATPS